jgi:glucose/arabinose dehydrogenase
MGGRQLRPTAILIAALALAAGACGQDGDPKGRRAAGTPSASTPAGSVPAISAPPAEPPTQAELNRVAVELEEVARAQTPVALAVAEDNTTFYVGERAGLVRVIRDGQLDPRLVLDLTDQVVVEGEGGLLGVALAPDGRHLYVSFTDAQHAVRLIEVAIDGGRVDPASRREVLTIRQPSTRHHGGNIIFGSDGLLWLGVGDGSPGGDAANAAQSLGELSGKLLRLDPTASGAKAYTVPQTNPFVNRKGARPEIWAYGLRNPWRFSFDRATSDLWIGDVGQYVVEEIDVIGLRRSKGANFGWRRLEGSRRFSGSPPSRAVPPVHEYYHRNGRCAVIGGHVYRGSQIRGLQGAYVYGDVCDGRIRALSWARGKPVRHRDLGLRLPGLVSFAEDRDGELYALSLADGIYRLVSVS